MAVLKHPDITFGGATPPTSIAELVAVSSIFPLIIPVSNGSRLRMPDPDQLELDTGGGGGGGGSVGYAT